jgi:hypothetical protein
MKINWVCIALGGILFIFIAGCSPSPMVLHPGFGKSVSLARHSQISNLAAPKNLDPMNGLQGRPVGKTVIQYEKSFDQKQKKSNKVGILVSPGGK